MSARLVQRLPTVLLYALAITLAFWTLFPIYLITLGAFSTQDAIYSYPLQLWPHHISTSTLSFFVNSAGTVPSLKRSAYVLLITMAIALPVGLPAAYAIARFSFRGANTLRLSVVGTRAFPIIILAIPLATTFIRWGIDDSILAVSLLHAALALPFVVLTCGSIFSGISVELEEAAMTLGCTRGRRVRACGAAARLAWPRGIRDLRRHHLVERGVRRLDRDAADTRRCLRTSSVSSNQATLPYRFAGGFFLLVPPLLMIFVIRRFLFGMWGQVVK